MLGNGAVGILAESCNKWERRAPLTPSHCARLLHCGKAGVSRIIVQPSTKRIYHDALYEDVGCEISDDLSECGLIVGVKQPQLEMILPDRAYAFFSHTHKAQKENMPLLHKILDERVTLYDYELIVGDHGKRLLAFGKYAGRAGMIDFLRGLGERYLSTGYSTAFLSLGASYMYPSLAAAKAAVISVGEEIATLGLPAGICPLVFIFTGSGNVSQGAQEIFKLLPHTFVDPSKLPELFGAVRGQPPFSKTTKRTFQVYGCVVRSQDMVKPNDSSKAFDKADYYSHPEHYTPIFHERIAPYASVIVNCIYWEHRFPRLLATSQLQDLMRGGCPLVGIADLTCDVGGSIEFVNQTTSINSPFFRYDPLKDSYHYDMEGNGVICSAVDILPTEFAKEASQHFGDILSKFTGHLASIKDIKELPAHLRRACIAQGGSLTSLYEYIPRMQASGPDELSEDVPRCAADKKKHTVLVSLTGHLFDKFLINDALDIIEAAGGSFHLVKCQVGQSMNDMSFSEVEIEITVFVENLSDSVGRRELSSLFRPFSGITDVFIPLKHCKLGAQFGFMQFDSEVAAGLVVLKTDNLKWKDMFLHVKKVVFGRGVGGTHSRSVALFSDVQQDERRGRPPSARGFIDRHPPWEGRALSFEAALFGGEREIGGDERQMCGEASLIVINGESHRVERLRRSCVTEKLNGGCAGLDASSLFLEMGVEGRFMKLGRVKGLLPFDSVEGFIRALLLDGSWWVNRGVRMTSWSESLVIKPVREM
ncbi:hypothetical protein Dimus_025807 [Dionaea muscipula]